MTHTMRCFSFGLLLASSALPGCSRSFESAPAPQLAAVSTRDSGNPSAAATASPGAAATSATARKIIRQAELGLAVGSPSAVQTAIERMAETHGGYVVSAARDADNEAQSDERVTVAVRVPEAELTTTIAEVKRLGRGTGSERITSNDVTDEYVDLVARSVAQRSLEQQYLEILKRAVTIKDAMEVQKELTTVRTEIERLQGRAQFLDKESAFSTLTVHLSAWVPKVAVSAPGLSDAVRRAGVDSLSLATDLIGAVIRFCAWSLPVLLIVVLPSVLGLWLLLRVARWLSARKSRRVLVEAT